MVQKKIHPNFRCGLACDYPYGDGWLLDSQQPVGVCFVHGPWYVGTVCPRRGEGDKGCMADKNPDYVKLAQRLFGKVTTTRHEALTNYTPLGQERMAEAMADTDNGEGPTGCSDDNTELSRALRKISPTRLNEILREEATVHWYRGGNPSEFPCGAPAPNMASATDIVDDVTCPPCRGMAEIVFERVDFSHCGDRLDEITEGAFDGLATELTDIFGHNAEEIYYRGLKDARRSGLYPHNMDDNPAYSSPGGDPL